MTDPTLDPNDGGMASRKFHVTILALCLTFGGMLLAAKYAGIAGVYGTMVGGVVSIVGLYCGINVASRFVAGTVNSKAKPKDSKSA